MAGLLEWQTTRPVQPQLASGVCKNNLKQRRLAIGLVHLLPQLTFWLLLAVRLGGAITVVVAVREGIEPLLEHLGVGHLLSRRLQLRWQLITR
jgi:hypothetical protein